MTSIDREDMVVIGMSIDALLACVRTTELWWQIRGDTKALLRTQQLGSAILATRRKFFADATVGDDDAAEALIVADGLREAAKQCVEGQAALHTRLIVAAEIIERLCRPRGAQP